jgi:hypothetical protein
MKLFMVLIGCTPPGRHTEQHDVYFGIGETIRDLVPQFLDFWPEAKGKLHLDGWREVNYVDGYRVEVVAAGVPAEPVPIDTSTHQPATNIPAALFFLNLGGYKPNELEEFHYKMLVAAPDKGVAIQRAKQTAFYKHTGFKGATSHIDDKYGVDVDDVYAIQDILNPFLKLKYSIQLSTAVDEKEDEIHLGYFMLHNL